MCIALRAVDRSILSVGLHHSGKSGANAVLQAPMMASHMHVTAAETTHMSTRALLDRSTASPRVRDLSRPPTVPASSILLLLPLPQQPRLLIPRGCLAPSRFNASRLVPSTSLQARQGQRPRVAQDFIGQAGIFRRALHASTYRKTYSPRHP
jgi:hypothetical protein